MPDIPWARYPWDQYIQQLAEAHVQYRRPDGWVPMYPDTIDRRLPSWTLYERSITEAWEFWLKAQRAETPVYVTRMFNDLYRHLGLWPQRLEQLQAIYVKGYPE